MSFHRDYDTLIHWLDEWNKDISIGRFQPTLKGVKKFMKYIVKKNSTVDDGG